MSNSSTILFTSNSTSNATSIDSTNYQGFHKAMVGELFIIFLLYLVFMFKFPKKYKSTEEPNPNNQNNQNENQGEQMDNRAPADPVEEPNDLSNMTDQLLVLFSHHTIGVGAAFFAPFTFQLVITWLHLPFVILYVLFNNKNKLTLSNIMLIIVFFIDLALILSGLIERASGIVMFANTVFNYND